MHVCLIMDKPETPRHPVIAAALHHLSATHTVRLLDLHALSGPDAIAQEDERTPADLYLLKGHTPQALEVARHLEERGALVVNTWASTSSCQDRALMAQRMRAVGLPWPRTWSLATLGSLLTRPELLVSVPLAPRAEESLQPAWRPGGQGRPRGAGPRTRGPLGSGAHHRAGARI